MEKQEKNTVTPYDLDGRPPLKLAIPLGLQHVLAMFVGNLTPLLIITAACGIEAGGELQVALLQNAMLIAVYEILEKAQITYAQKTEVYKVVKELGTEAVPVLVSMNLNPSLLGVLMEILTMGI